MRWIFFVLLGANILLFGWHMLFYQPLDRRQAFAPVSPLAGQDVPSIRLLRDAPQRVSTPENTPPENTPENAPLAEVVDSDELEKSLCTFVGPFGETAKAEQLVERLSAMGVQGEVAKVDIPAGPGYWVYLKPLASRREALRRLAELQAQGVDSYVIPRGELANGISLGMFSKEPLAQARMREMADMGITPELHVIERSYQEVWVSIPAAQASGLGDQAWRRLLESPKNTERKQNFCLHVASQDNFH